VTSPARSSSERTKPVNRDSGDYPLPSASTCFFSLTLPDYPEKELLRQKSLYAIQHVTTWKVIILQMTLR